MLMMVLMVMLALDTNHYEVVVAVAVVDNAGLMHVLL